MLIASTSVQKRGNLNVLEPVSREREKKRWRARGSPRGDPAVRERERSEDGEKNRQVQ